jgi:hypothetical protein
VGSGLALGRMKLVAKKKKDGENTQGMIVSFIPASSFTGNISDVSTKTFRKMKFSGLIVFNEIKGCPSNAYKVEKGVVVTKMDILQKGQLGVRCGEIITVTYGSYGTVTKDASTGQCTFTLVGTKTTISYGVPCFSSIQDLPYGLSSNAGSDFTYVSYLAPPVITRLCASSIAIGLSEPFWNINMNSTGCLSNNNVNIKGAVFEDLRLGNGSRVDMPYVEIEVTGISNLPMTPSVLATQVQAAFSAARQNHFRVTPLDNNKAFAKEWMSAFNNAEGNKGRYCLLINPIGPQEDKPVRSLPLRDASDPNCR